MLEPVATPTIAGVEYQIHRIDTRKQFHMARRLGPAVVAILPTLNSLKSLKSLALGDSDGEAMTPENQGKALSAIFDALPSIASVLARMSDEDADYVINAALDVCYRRQEAGNFARVRSNGAMMFSDLSLEAMVMLTVEAIKANLGGFSFIEQPKASVAARQE